MVTTVVATVGSNSCSRICSDGNGRRSSGSSGTHCSSTERASTAAVAIDSAKTTHICCQFYPQTLTQTQNTVPGKNLRTFRNYIFQLKIIVYVIFQFCSFFSHLTSPYDLARISVSNKNYLICHLWMYFFE